MVNSKNTMIFKDYTPDFTLSYVDDFYFLCEMSDRTILIQNTSDTDIQFDARFNESKRNYSYTLGLSLNEYNLFKKNEFKLNSIQSIIEQAIIHCLFNYVDENMVQSINQHLGTNSYINSVKTNESITVETNSYHFMVEMSQFNYVPEPYYEYFIYDPSNGQVYVKKTSDNHTLMPAFSGVKFTKCDIAIYESLSSNDFKVLINNALLGSVMCYSDKGLYIYDQTFGDINHYTGERDFINATILRFFSDVIKYEPSALMNKYVEDYKLDIDNLTSDQLEMLIMASI
jgi:tRNA U38,U39,U40 pseudouridine synthase TruA